MKPEPPAEEVIHLVKAEPRESYRNTIVLSSPNTQSRLKTPKHDRRSCSSKNWFLEAALATPSNLGKLDSFNYFSELKSKANDMQQIEETPIYNESVQDDEILMHIKRAESVSPDGAEPWSCVMTPIPKQLVT